jgi:signal transduction histidine kinase
VVGERIETWLRRHVVTVDATIAVLLLLGCLAVSAGDRAVMASSVGLVAPLAVRRRYPVVAGVLTTVVAFGQWLLLHRAGGVIPADVAVPIVVYAVAGYGPRWAGWGVLGVGLLGVALGALRWPDDSAYPAGTGTHPAGDHWVIAVALTIGVFPPWALGLLRRSRREQLESLRERARLLEVERDQRARLAVTAERARIARDLHDVVAHALAVIIAQADGGRYAAAGSPDAAAAALGTIGDTGRRALSEMRRLLAVLRDDVDGRGDPDLLPQPAIEDLPALIGRVRAGGLDVQLRQEGEVDGVGPGIGLVVYRVVQEALTNVLKHAGPRARARVTVRRVGAEVEVEVVDDGRGAGASPPDHGPAEGQGLLGMRERVTAYGGTVQAGPRQGGGYAVSARIPVLAG